MLGFQNDLIINDLKSKADHWFSNQGQAQYTSGFSLNESAGIGKFGIDRTDTGYYYLSDTYISNVNLDTGRTVRIKLLPSDQDRDWNCLQALYNKSQESGSNFRMDRPVQRSKFTYRNSTWEFGEFTAPNSQFGTTISHYIKTWPPLVDGLHPNSNIPQSTTDEVLQKYKDYINYVKVVVDAALEVANDNNCGIPFKFIVPDCIYEDDNGLFLSEIEDAEWVLPETHFRGYLMQVVESLTVLPKIANVLPEAYLTDLEAHFNTVWGL